MPKKAIGFVLVALGVVIAAVSLLADVIGIGSGGGIGWHQWLGAAVGVILAFAGAWLSVSKAGEKQ